MVPGQGRTWTPILPTGVRPALGLLVKQGSCLRKTFGGKNHATVDSRGQKQDSLSAPLPKLRISGPHPRVQRSDPKHSSVTDAVPPCPLALPPALDVDTHLGPGGEERRGHLPVSGPPLAGEQRDLGGREG